MFARSTQTWCGRCVEVLLASEVAADRLEILSATRPSELGNFTKRATSSLTAFGFLVVVENVRIYFYHPHSLFHAAYIE